jgi:hypothetical protein
VTSVLSSVEAALQDHFAQPPAKASVSFLGVEPIDVLRFEPIPDEVAYASLGMSRRPMTAPGEPVRTDTGPRAELMLHLHATTVGSDEVWRHVALLAAAPDVEGVVYVAGMTVDLGEPLAAGSVCTGFVVGESPVDSVATDAGDVAILQVVPATSTELAWARVHGTPALRQRWAEHHSDLLDLGRRPVPLD